MPAVFIHQLLGEDILERLDDKIKNKITDKDLFFLGLQGGDTLFLSSNFKGKTENLGRMLHNKNTAEIFATFKNLSAKNPKYYSYIAGYFIHFIADGVMHPYINALTDKLQASAKKHRKKDIYHFLIESEIDIYLFKKYKNLLPSEFVFKPKFKNVDKQAFASIMQSLFKEVFALDVSLKIFCHALKYFYRYLRLIESKRGTKRKVFYFLEKILFIPHILSYLMRTKDDKDFKSNFDKVKIDELFQSSVTKALEVLPLLLS